MDLKQAAATAWSGIRGFVGLILALMVYVDTSIDDQAYKLLCFFFMATTACLTIVIQGGAFEIILWVSISSHYGCNKCEVALQVVFVGTFCLEIPALLAETPPSNLVRTTASLDYYWLQS